VTYSQSRTVAHSSAATWGVLFQFEMRQILLAIAMCGVAFFWCQRFGSLAFALPISWLTGVTTFIPALYLLARRYRQVERLWPATEVVFLGFAWAGAVTVWGFAQSLMYLSNGRTAHSPDWASMYTVGLRASLCWTFGLPVMLTMIAWLGNHQRTVSGLPWRLIVVLSAIALNVIGLFGLTSLLELTFEQMDEIRTLLS
jgi:hypothetical protein